MTARGVLLVNVGTPDAPTTPAVRRYLAQFLSDPRVVDLPAWKWKPILHGIVLRFRPKRSAALYKRIWTDAGSPLLIESRAQQAALQGVLGDEHVVELGMCVGNPSVASGLDRLMQAGCREIVVLPLFPQHSSSTVGAAFDCVAKWGMQQRDLPTLHFVRGFATEPGFIEALASRVREAGVSATADEPLLISFHGIPQRYVDDGDPYEGECRETAEALRESLGLPSDATEVVFQSRFGREAWLQPYAEPRVEELARSGTTKVAVSTPSFVADCLETIDEIGRELRESFEEAGGRDYTFVPCVGAHPAFIDGLARLVRASG